MQFLNPFVLFGLIASSIPIIIHLINLRKQKKVEFSSLKFLKELQNTKIRNIKLRQILLLILRTLLVTFIVLAFARPTIQNAIPGFVSYANNNSGVIIDNSFSMDLSDLTGNRFRQTRNIFTNVINNLESGDKVFVSGSNFILDKNIELSSNKNEINKIFQTIKIESGKSRINDIIIKSNLLFEENKELNSDLIIINDFQKNFIDQIDTNNNTTISQLSFVKIGKEFKTKNISIDSVRILTSIFQENKPVEIDVYISNNSESLSSNNLLSLKFNNNRVAQKSFNIEGNQSIVLPISGMVNSSGATNAIVEIENDDILQDNKFYFGFIIPSKPKVLLISDAKRTFAEIALKTRNIEENIKVTSTKEFSTVNLSEFNVIVNSSEDLSANDLSRLEKYIANGGTTVLLAADSSKLNTFKPFYTKLGFTNIQANTYSNKIKFDRVEKLHPIFSGLFQGDSDPKSIVESPEISKSVTLSGGFSMISANGKSFMNEIEYGNGKAIYFAVSQDLRWSNFALTGLFPAILNRSVIYLSGGKGNFYQSDNNDKIVLNIPKNIALDNNFVLINPTGIESTLKASELPSGSVLIIEELAEEGTYFVKNSNNNYVAVFALNHDPKESILEYYSQSEMETILKAKFPNSKINIIEDYNEFNLKELRTNLGTELWQLFLILALLCGLAELFVQKAYKTEME